MTILALAEAYISRHARNIGTDVVQHLKAFAAHAEASLSKAADTVETDATEAVSYVEQEADKVKLAAEALAQHAEGSFAKLLAAESTPETPTTESPAQ